MVKTENLISDFFFEIFSRLFDTKWQFEDNWWSWETAVTFVFFFVNNPFCGILFRGKNPVFDKKKKEPWYLENN